jgi:hypothetical protein
MNSESDNKGGRSHNTQIIIALISLMGVLGAALFANWDKIFPLQQTGNTVHENVHSQEFEDKERERRLEEERPVSQREEGARRLEEEQRARELEDMERERRLEEERLETNGETNGVRCCPTYLASSCRT